MTIFYLFPIIYRRLLSRFGLTLLFISTSALAVGLVTSVPIFAGSVSARIIQQELGMFNSARQHLRPVTARFYASATASRPLDIAEGERVRGWLAQSLLHHVGIPIEAVFMEVHSPRYDLMPAKGDTHYDARVLDAVYVVYADQVGQRLRLIDGSPFGVIADGEVLNVWIPGRYAEELNLRVGDRFVVGDAYDAAKGSAEVLIAGVWERQYPEELFWWYTDTLWDTDGLLLTTQQQFEQHIYPNLPSQTQSIAWQFILNDHRMNLSQAERYIAGFEMIQREVGTRLPRGGMSRAPTEYLLRGQQRKEALTVILLAFSIPLMAIILYTVSALSTALVRFQAQEIAMLASRGGTRLQITLFSLLETIIMTVMALPLGLGIALLLARLLGYSTSFLQFEVRSPLPVYLESADWRLIALTLGTIVLARLVPTWSSAGHSIITQERQSARWRWALGTMRLLVMAVLASVTFYSYYRLNQVGTLALISWERDSPSHDPLLLAAPSLFFLIVPLFLSELFAGLIRPVAWVGQMARSTALYLGLQDLGREGLQYRASTYMLIFCLSLGVFYASLAKTADTWLVDRRRYEIGCDLLYNPRGVHIVAGRFGKVDTESDFYEPAHSIPWSEFGRVAGVEAVSPVADHEAAILGMRAPFVRLLAVDRLTFPDVAYFRADYATEPLGLLMNRLGTQQEGLLMPSTLLSELSLSVGDRIKLSVLVDQEVREPYDFVIVGAFDYFPTMFPEVAPVAVANMAYLQSQSGGLLPYGVWMRTQPEVDGAELIQQIIRHTRVIPERVVNLHDLFEIDRTRLERVGLFGVLSICFLSGTLLAIMGLLVQNAAAMRRRSLRFAVLQAVGLSRGGLLLMILIEYIAVLFYGVFFGLGLGIIGARLYVPFYRLTEKAAIPIPPYIPLIDNERAALMALAMAAALVVLQGMVLWRLVRIRVFETLRLGTRE